MRPVVLYTRNGEPMLVAHLSDDEGSFPAVVTLGPRTYCRQAGALRIPSGDLAPAYRECESMPLVVEESEQPERPWSSAMGRRQLTAQLRELLQDSEWLGCLVAALDFPDALLTPGDGPAFRNLTALLEEIPHAPR